MKRHNSLPILIIAFILFSTSCELLSDKNYIEKKRILQHELNDVYIYSTFDKSKIDTFIVTDSNNFYDYDEITNSQILTVSLNYRRYSKTFLQYMVTYNNVNVNYKNGLFYFTVEDKTSDFIINGIKYNDVFVGELDTGGDSDSIINRIRYHGIVGVLTYRYENGDEFLLDTII